MKKKSNLRIHPKGGRRSDISATHTRERRGGLVKIRFYCMPVAHPRRQYLCSHWPPEKDEKIEIEDTLALSGGRCTGRRLTVTQERKRNRKKKAKAYLSIKHCPQLLQQVVLILPWVAKITSQQSKSPTYADEERHLSAYLHRE